MINIQRAHHFYLTYVTGHKICKRKKNFIYGLDCTCEGSISETRSGKGIENKLFTGNK